MSLDKDLRWKQRFQNYESALKSLEEALVASESLSALEQDGAIKRFEIAFELAWKVLQDYFEAQEYLGIKGPRSVIKQAFQNQIVEEGHLWMKLLEDRNLTVHIYNEEKSRFIFNKIVNGYLGLLQQLHKAMKAKL